MSLLLDDRIDTKPIVVDEPRPLVEGLADIVRGKPTLAMLQRAALLFVDATPDKLARTASWLHAMDVLEASGFDAEDQLQVLMRATVNAYAPKVYQPADAVLREALCRVGPDVAEAAAESFLELENPNAGQARKGELAVLALARHGEPPPKFDPLILLKLEWPDSREVLLALPEARRRARIEALLCEPFNRQNAIWRARTAFRFMDLMEAPTVALLDQRIREIAGMPNDRGDDAVAELSAEFERGYEVPEEYVRRENGLTDKVTAGLDYWLDKFAAERLREGLGPLAEERSAWAIDVDAPELATLQTWRAATAQRRSEVAQAVELAAAPFGLRLVGFETYEDGLPLAVYEQEATGMRLSLVPGGRYLRGFSEREEALVRAAGEADRGAHNWYETYQVMLDEAPTMRPAQEVEVGPILVFQTPSDPRAPAEVTVLFEEMAFRLPTEAEHEWLLRGGRSSQLTWRGDDVPDENWIETVMREEPRNPFGLARLGLYPEVLSDVWHSGYDGGPVDGSARSGPGPRVVRGGAERYYPWQACGEWQMLTNALRTSAAQWEYFLSMRPAIGVRI